MLFRSRLIVLAAIAANLLLMIAALLSAGALMAVLGQKIEAVITRLLGVLLAALAVQFVIDGLQANFRYARGGCAAAPPFCLSLPKRRSASPARS